MKLMADDDENTMTEITIQPDGRVYLFGTSRAVLEMMESLAPHDLGLRRILGHVRGMPAAAALPLPMEKEAS